MSSIYGVELLKDNVEECKDRLYKIWERAYEIHCKNSINIECKNSIKFILDKNILQGDALSLKQTNGNPIIFSEWTALNSVLLKRRDFRLDEMLEGHEKQLNIFMTDWEYDEEIKAMIPKPIQEYTPVHYKKVNTHE